THFHHGQDSLQEGSRQGRRRQEEEQEAHGILLHLHLQGPQAGPPRHRHQQEGDEHHELVHQRHLRAHRRRGREARHLQQEGHPLVPRDPDGRSPHAPRRARQARRVRGNQGGHQVLFRLNRSCSHHYSISTNSLSEIAASCKQDFLKSALIKKPFFCSSVLTFSLSPDIKRVPSVPFRRAAYNNIPPYCEMVVSVLIHKVRCTALPDDKVVRILFT
ncbi:hypothetical protein ACHAWF_000958, partial [Thalassiosira exigua]